MKTGTKHKTAKCEDRNCQKYEEPLQYTNIYEGWYFCILVIRTIL